MTLHESATAGQEMTAAQGFASPGLPIQLALPLLKVPLGSADDSPASKSGGAALKLDAHEVTQQTHPLARGTRTMIRKIARITAVAALVAAPSMVAAQTTCQNQNSCSLGATASMTIPTLVRLQIPS